MAQRFSSGNALLHFARTDGPRGFVWKYLLTYAAFAILLMGVGYALFQPVFNLVFRAILSAAQGASEREVEAIFTRRLTELIGWIVLANIVMLFLGALFWAVFEAAVQRRYVREEGFSVRLGGDELRLLLVGLIWFAFSVAAYILSLVVIASGTGVLVMALDNPRGGGFAILGAMLMVALVWVWIVVRLAPASAMTIRDRKVTFFGAWGATKGRFWQLVWAYVGLALMIVLMLFLANMVFGTAIVASFMANIERLTSAADSGNPLTLLSALLQFDILAPVLTAWLGWLMLQGLIQYMWAGPAALAAKTDPRGGGIAQAPDVFA
ncbi:hypothetical protein [Henriciella aquimarina]|uniref:hypothetical protein n=1 Tax=Henriciella aquimarina TaxID=545261 RepID=UPI000A06590F|nr:hypothetical protein [Henriciella aquimarina]